MAAEFMLVTFQRGGLPSAGVVVDGRVTPLPTITGVERHVDMMAVLEDWGDVGPLLAGEVQSAGPALEDVTLLAPLPHPAAIYCAGANYADHAAEMAAQSGAEVEDPRGMGLSPWHFIKSSHTVVGPESAVVLPEGAQKVDWEAELAVVIGRRAKGISIENALSVVAGYTIANDLSARDLSRRPPLSPGSPFFYDWMGHKNFDGACPMGPGIAPARQIPDPNRLKITLEVNGEVKQRSNTNQMIYDVAEQIAALSRRLTLWPGDVILTGTPAGVGAGRGEFLAAGDDISIEIEGIGTLRHRMVGGA